MKSSKISLVIYSSILYAAFAALFAANFRPLNWTEWLIIIAMAIVSTIFDAKSIVLPSGEDLSLVSPILLAATVLYGILAVFYIVLFMAVFLTIRKPKNWHIHLFNSTQYALAAYAGLWTYQTVIGLIPVSSGSEFYGYFGFIISYFIVNTSLTGGYLILRGGAFGETLKMLLDAKSLLVYFTIMVMGILMAEIVKVDGIYGVVVFSIVLAGVGTSYRNYYKMFDHFRSLAIKDELTGLYNHRYFQEQLHDAMAKENVLSLILMDLDYFKMYNDMYGHPQGDKLLQEIAQILTENLPKTAVCCRYGGDEFSVILPGRNTDHALVIAESIRRAIAGLEFYGLEHLPKKKMTVSIGVSTYPAMAERKEDLILAADEALYKVKYTTRDKVQMYSSLIDELKGSFQFENEDAEVIQTIKTFLTIINSKDRYTYSHTERNMEYAEALARKINLPEGEIKYIRYGALLHDIGKIEIPSEILNKRTRLNDDEWQIMKDHVLWGEQIVQPLEELKPCLPIIRYHHEHYNGKGYPDGLQGEDIPLAARILTVVDSFDAMTTNRPYQKARTVEAAVEELRRCKGSQFDPALAEAFIEVIKEHPEKIPKGA